MDKNVTQTADKAAAEAPETTTGRRIYRPPTDIVETDEGVILMLEVPGVAAEGVDITLEKRVLTVRGKVIPNEPEPLQLTYAEYGEGNYERTFTLLDDFDSEKITAATANGVLTVRVPHAKEVKPKKITVEAL